MKLYVFTTVSLILAGLMAPAHAGTGQFAVEMPDKTFGNIKMVYKTDAAQQCFHSGRDGSDLKAGLEHCNTALRDPAMNYRARTFANRGVIRFDLHDYDGALVDFQSALSENPALSEVYFDQALVLIEVKRPQEALAAIDKGLASGAHNLEIAYYGRAEIEEDAGDYAGAYRDYKKALAAKPDYAPARRQLEHFKPTTEAVTDGRPSFRIAAE